MGSPHLIKTQHLQKKPQAFDYKPVEEYKNNI